MRSELKNWLAMIVVIAIVAYALLGRLAYGGAPIPIDPHYVIVNAPRIERLTGSCIPVQTQTKMYRCDRVFANGFG